jgi:hypothetical protein
MRFAQVATILPFLGLALSSSTPHGPIAIEERAVTEGIHLINCGNTYSVIAVSQAFHREGRLCRDTDSSSRTAVLF